MFEQQRDTLSVWASVSLVAEAGLSPSLADALKSVRDYWIDDDQRLHWSVSSEDYYYGFHGEDHLNVLKNIVNPIQEDLKLIAKNHAQVRYCLSWRGAKKSPLPSLPNPLIEELTVPHSRFDMETLWDEGVREAEDAAAHFSITGEDLDFEHLEQVFGVPSMAYKKGDPVSQKKQTRRYRKNSLWRISSEDGCSSRVVSEHLDHLLDRLGTTSQAWRDYVKQQSIQVTVSVYGLESLRSITPYPSHDTLKRIGALGACFWFDVGSFHDL